jgi:hypothetical protein
MFINIFRKNNFYLARQYKVVIAMNPPPPRRMAEKKQSHLDGQKGITSVFTLLRNDGRHGGQ